MREQSLNVLVIRLTHGLQNPAFLLIKLKIIIYEIFTIRIVVDFTPAYFFFNFLIVSGGGKKKNIYYTYKFNRKLFDVCINYVTPSSIYDFCLLFFLSNLAISFKSSSLGS